MKLDLLDAYIIRARLSASIILLAPIAITLFLCFEDIASFAVSSVFLFVLLAFTNYVPILQRRLNRNNKKVDYAAQFLHSDDTNIDAVTKQRYYSKLAHLDNSFAPFLNPNVSSEFKNCCKSAVNYLRENTRDNHLVQEENINYGFCKNLYATKIPGIILSVAGAMFTFAYAYIKFNTLNSVSPQFFLSFAANISLLLFWCFGVTEGAMEISATYYAKTLLAAIDSLSES